MPILIEIRVETTTDDAAKKAIAISKVVCLFVIVTKSNTTLMNKAAATIESTSMTADIIDMAMLPIADFSFFFSYSKVHLYCN
jgi:hypothetical protein